MFLLAVVSGSPSFSGVKKDKKVFKILLLQYVVCDPHKDEKSKSASCIQIH